MHAYVSYHTVVNDRVPESGNKSVLFTYLASISRIKVNVQALLISLNGKGDIPSISMQNACQ